jgi:alpha-L-fucosidase 2
MSSLPNRWIQAVLLFSTLSTAAPPGFPASGNGLWFNASGSIWSKDYLPIGNGYLAGTDTSSQFLNREPAQSI